MLFGNRSTDLSKSDPDDDLYEDFNYRCVCVSPPRGFRVRDADKIQSRTDYSTRRGLPKVGGCRGERETDGSPAEVHVHC